MELFHFPKYVKLILYRILSAEEGNLQKIISMVSEGFLMGEFLADQRWLVNKTFISKETASLKTGLLQKEIVAALENNLAMLHGNENSDEFEDLLRLYRSMGLMVNNEFNPGLNEKIQAIHEGKGFVGDLSKGFRIRH